MSNDQGRSMLGGIIFLPSGQALADSADGRSRSLGCRPDAAAAHNLLGDPRRIPIAETAETRPSVFFLRNAPFHCQTHTTPHIPLNLEEYPAGDNLDGFVAMRFGTSLPSWLGGSAFSPSCGIDGFEPNRSEMVFERSGSSCYPR